MIQYKVKLKRTKNQKSPLNPGHRIFNSVYNWVVRNIKLEVHGGNMKLYASYYCKELCI
jgi:hypothetical protein